MKNLNKISAIALIAVFALSISGLKFHFHFCGLENKLYTAVHLPDGADHEILCECNKDSKPCCQKSVTSDGNSNNHADTCIDFEKTIETDRDYQLSQYNLSIELQAIEIFNVKGFQQSSLEIAFVSQEELIYYYPPPDPIFTSSFLL